MRILHTESSLGWGGQEIRILTEAAGMMRRGHRVGLICPRSSRIFSEARRFGVPVTALPIARRRPVGIVALARFLATHPVNVVNTHSSIDSWLVALACRSPWVSRARADEFRLSLGGTSGSTARDWWVGVPHPDILCCNDSTIFTNG